MARFAVGLSLVLFAVKFTSAQSPDPAAGNLPFAAQTGGQYDSVDLATSNILVTVPVRTKNQKIPFSFALYGNSHAYTYPNVNNHNVPTWAVSSGSTSAFVLIGRERLLGTGLTSSTRTITCGSDTKDTESYNFAVIDSFGTAHPLPSTIKVDNDKCDKPPATGLTTDGSGYTMQVSNFSVWNRSGVEVFNNPYNPIVTDPDNAQESVTWNGSTATYTDSLNTTVLTEVLGGGGPDTYTYLGGDGSSSDGVTVSYTNYHQKTVFGCSGITDLDYSQIPLPTTVAITGGGALTITYETTPGYAGQKDSNGLYYVSGRIQKITYPSGGSVTYAYSGGNNGVNCSSKVVPTLTRKVNDNNGNVGTWTYVNSNTSATSGDFTVTETDPAGNQTVHHFAGEYQTLADYYQGGCPTSITGCNGGGTELRFVTTCYNANFSSCVAPSSVPMLPITQTDVYTWVGPPAQSLVETTLDNYGNTTKVSRYDWGAAIPPSSGPPPISTETLTYTGCGVSSSLDIFDKPCSDIVLNSAGTTVRQTNFTYSSTGHPTSVSGWVRGSNWLTNTAQYNLNGTLQWSKDSAGNKTSYAYAATGSGGCNSLLLTSTTYPLAAIGSDSQGWDCNGGVVTSRTDVNGKTTTFAYSDPLYRLTQVTYPDSSSHVDTYAYHTGTSYPWYTYWTKAATASTSLTGYSYVDGLGRPTTKETDAYGWQNTTYNNLGQVYTVSNPYLSTSDPTYGLTTYTYDALGRVKQVSNPDGSAVNSTYTNRAVQVSGIYGLNRIYQYDGLGRMLYVCDGINSPTQFGTNATVSACNLDIAANGFEESLVYDALSNLKTISYSGQTRSFAYDGLSRRTSAAYPETGTTTYSYDNTPGQLYQATDARNKVTTYAYDAMNRVTGITFNDSSFNPITYGYDQSSLWGNPLTNGKGRLTSGYVQTSGGTLQAEKGLSYDSMGRVIDTYSCAPLSCGHSSTHLGYTFDFTGDRLSLYDGDNGLTVGYTYDTIGDLTSITSSLSNAVYPATLVSGFTYNALRLPTQDSRADGVTETYSYDQMGRMLAYDAGSLYTLSLGYNTAGDVTSATDSINGTWTYSYYGTMMHKLSWAGCSANCSNGWANFAFAFDQYGNRWQQVPSGNGGGPLYTFTSSNQISTSDGVSYNASGDMIADGNGNTYSYDAFHRVNNISGNTVAAFIYDAFGDRVNENPGQSGSNLDLVFDQGKILHRNNSTSGNGWGMEIQAGKHIGFYNDHFYFDYQDQVGSTRMMTQYTNTGSTVVETCPDLPFGDWSACSGTMPGKDWFRFADFLVDADQQAVSQTRRLSTVQGRWSSPDPAGLAAMDLTNPQTLNLYSYVMNNPLTFIDPTGLVTINPNWYMGFAGGGGNCNLDGVDATCNMVNALAAGGALVYFPSNCTYVACQTSAGFVPISQHDDGQYGGCAQSGLSMFCIHWAPAPLDAANNDSWGWTFTKSFFSGFSVFGPKNDPRPSCFGKFASAAATNFAGIPGVDTVAAGAAAHYGISLSQAQAIPNTRVARGGISPSQWLEADEAARVANAGKFSLLFNADVAMAQAFFQNELPAALAGECK